MKNSRTPVPAAFERATLKSSSSEASSKLDISISVIEDAFLEGERPCEGSKSSADPGRSQTTRETYILYKSYRAKSVERHVGIRNGAVAGIRRSGAVTRNNC